MTKWRTTYDQAVARGTLLDAVAEFKRQGGTIPSVEEAVRSSSGEVGRWRSGTRCIAKLRLSITQASHSRP
jgi:hypothetical protein